MPLLLTVVLLLAALLFAAAWWLLDAITRPMPGDDYGDYGEANQAPKLAHTTGAPLRRNTQPRKRVF